MQWFVKLNRQIAESEESEPRTFHTITSNMGSCGESGYETIKCCRSAEQGIIHAANRPPYKNESIL